MWQVDVSAAPGIVCVAVPAGDEVDVGVKGRLAGACAAVETGDGGEKTAGFAPSGQRQCDAGELPLGFKSRSKAERDQGKAVIGNQGLLIWMKTRRHPSTKATSRSGMSKDLYVKNLSLQATEEDLRKLFSLMGKVTYIHLVKDAKSGHFVGAAYVKMSTDEEARAARIDLDGTRLIDRVIVVTEARDRTAPVGKNSDRPGPPRKKPFKGKRNGGSRGRA
jgi:hypothetical protein